MAGKGGPGAWLARVVPPGERADAVRRVVVDANDGIIATAGIVEGFIGAGASGSTVVTAAFAAMFGGAIALAGVKYVEEAAEHDARTVVLAEERRRLELSPAEELAELAALYEERGLPPALALEVARELSARDPLAAHAEAEYGVPVDPGLWSPRVVAGAAAVAFVAGAAVPLLAVVLAPDPWRVWVTAAAVLVSLAATSVIVARAGRAPVLRTLARTVGIGALAVAATYAGGTLFAP